jgi:hypothetical protein
MKQDEGPPPISERLNIPLKVVAVLLGYLIYRLLVEDAIAGPLFVAAGFTMIAYTLINRWTLRRLDRSDMMQVGTAILGAGLIGLGALLTFTS